MSQTAITVTYKPVLADTLHAARVADGELWKTSSRVVATVLVITAGLMWHWGSTGWAVGFLAFGLAEWFNLLPVAVAVAWVEFHRNPKYRQQYTITMGPDGLLFSTATVRAEIAWSFYRHFWETDRAFVLSYGSGLPSVIPKSAFKSDEELALVRALLGSQVGPATRSGSVAGRRTMR